MMGQSVSPNSIRTFYRSGSEGKAANRSEFVKEPEVGAFSSKEFNCRKAEQHFSELLNREVDKDED